MIVPVVTAVGTAVPDNPVKQSDIQAFAASLFRDDLPNLERLLPVFQNAAIHTRHFAQPLEWYEQQHSFAEANALYDKLALELGAEAAFAALAKADFDPAAIEVVVFVSSTGIATPTLDSKLIGRLGFPASTVRVPLWGLGCAGGVAGLARAADLVRATGKTALLVAVELCSLTFQRSDASKSNLVGTSIFADGAAAVIITPGDCGLELLDSYSQMFPNTEDVMGWDVSETGLKVRFSQNIPAIIREELPAVVKQACCRWGVPRGQLRHFVVHPGGIKVLKAYQDSLGLSARQLSDAYSVLYDYGNMSSATALFVLEQFLDHARADKEYGIMAALGPGFSAEQVLFRW